ncbi:hypothetical protein [Parvularcula sp. IMCC14364]|uniref:hypothetical protein n=1 Tax=Parvularcula sp. IMCC14364 TaxID=3067902 RepID=UPI002740D108|nr:hypothetical protein [Parvularcula sp. IMCC14364]
MDITKEKELRDRVADFILNWHTDGDPQALESATSDDFSRLIVEAYIAADESNKSLKQWVQSGRRAGLSWADVGTLLGISRQAAQQRFSIEPNATYSDEPNFDPLDRTRIMRTGVTSFNEVEVLREEGAKGRKVVGATWLKLYFTQTDAPVENIRVVSLRGPSLTREYENAGWTHALTWFPYRYFTRPLTEKL